jgi:hypothetical protein
VDRFARLAARPPVIADAATTANITLSGSQTVDGVALAAGTAYQYCLVKNQSTAAQNGFYRVKSGTWDKIGQPDLVLVRQGSANGPAGMFLLTDANEYTRIGGTVTMEAVRLADTATGGTMDSVSVANGNKVLVTSGASAGVWSYDGSTFTFAGQPGAVAVREGSANGRHVYMLTASNTYSKGYAVYAP